MVTGGIGHLVVVVVATWWCYSGDAHLLIDNVIVDMTPNFGLVKDIVSKTAIVGLEETMHLDGSQ